MCTIVLVLPINITKLQKEFQKQTQLNFIKKLRKAHILQPHMILKHKHIFWCITHSFLQLNKKEKANLQMGSNLFPFGKNSSGLNRKVSSSLTHGISFRFLKNFHLLSNNTQTVKPIFILQTTKWKQKRNVVMGFSPKKRLCASSSSSYFIFYFIFLLLFFLNLIDKWIKQF